MKTISPRTGFTAGATVLFLLLVAVYLYLNNKNNTPLKNVQFKHEYASVIDSLHARMQTVSDKLRTNLPGDLKILPEKRLRAPKSDQPVETDPPLEKPSINRINLRGIFWSSSMPLAEINNSLCKPGDTIEGLTLEEIQPYQVIFSDWEGTRHTNSLMNKAAPEQ